MAAGRHGVREIAESYILIYIQSAKTSLMRLTKQPLYLGTKETTVQIQMPSCLAILGYTGIDNSYNKENPYSYLCCFLFLEIGCLCVILASLELTVAQVDLMCNSLNSVS